MRATQRAYSTLELLDFAVQTTVSPHDADGFNEPDSPSQDRWWFYLWLGWGTLCALLVGLIDQSLAAGLFWLSIGLLIGRFGLVALVELASAIDRIQTRLFPANKFPFSDPSADTFTETTSYLAVLTDGTINILDPRRMHWEAYPGVVCMVGIMFGVLAGGVVGALFPVSYEWQMTAFDGALWGVGIGPLFISLYVAILFPMIMYKERLGPSVEAIRPVMKAAAEEAESRDAEYLVPGHVLLEILRNPTGSMKSLLAKYPFDLHEIEPFLLLEIEQDLRIENILEESPGLWTVLETAIQAAKDRKHSMVESGHLLLGLIEAWPTVTLLSLERIGLQSEKAREEILAHVQTNEDEQKAY